jgi:hypothetical protein
MEEEEKALYAKGKTQGDWKDQEIRFIDAFYWAFGGLVCCRFV